MDHPTILDNESAISVIRTLIYYDVFEYPLSEREILENSILQPEEKKQCQNILQSLIIDGIIYKIDDYYSLKNDLKRINNRNEGNRRAIKWMKKARWFSNLISKFPYIRGVSVSGSLSKGFLGENPDIDYFIITKPNRLWLARTLLVAFKKIFLFNSYKYFCVNYFIDTENLEIDEKNLFTATEIVTMIPMYGNGVKDKFYQSNLWIHDYYPNYFKERPFQVEESQTGYFKIFLEQIMNNQIGDWLDSYFMKLTINHWKKKFGDKFSKEEFQLVFKSNKRISKHHPRNFQQKVYDEFNDRKRRLENEKNISLKKVVFQL